MTLAVSVALLVATVYLFTITPKGFLPSEDVSRFNMSTEAIQGVGFEDMVRHQQQMADIVAADPNVARSGANVGTGNSGRVFIDLKPREERALNVDGVMAELRVKLAQVPGMRAYLTNPPPVNLGGQQGARSLYQFTLQDTDTDELYRWAPMLEDKIRQLPGIEDVSSDLQLKNPEVQIDMDRKKIAVLGLTVNQVETALFSAFGTRQVSQIYGSNNQYQVIMQVAPAFQRDPSSPSLLYVRSSAGRLDSALHGGHRHDRRRAADRGSHGSTAIGHDLLQPQGGRVARRRRVSRSTPSRPPCCPPRSRRRSRVRRRRFNPRSTGSA